MAFNQNFKKVTEVINIENSSLDDGGDAFKQTYDEVVKVINTQYDSSHLDAISPLVKNLIAMDEVQTEKFYDEVINQSSVSNSNEDEFIKLKQHMLNRKNKKEAVLDSVYSSCARMAAQIAIQRTCTAAIKASEVLA